MLSREAVSRVQERVLHAQERAVDRVEEIVYGLDAVRDECLRKLDRLEPESRHGVFVFFEHLRPLFIQLFHQIEITPGKPASSDEVSDRIPALFYG